MFITYPQLRLRIEPPSVKTEEKIHTKDARNREESTGLRHPKNNGERLELNRFLQASGRDHRGRTSRDQNRKSHRRHTPRRADFTAIQYDRESDQEERVQVVEYYDGGATPFVNQLQPWDSTQPVFH